MKNRFQRQRLRELREGRGMSQAELSEASGIHRVSIARYELGIIVPTVDSLARLADALDVPMSELIDVKKAG